MNRRQFIFAGTAVVAVLIVVMTVLSLNDNLTYYLYPNEAVAQRTEFEDGRRFRLAGQVVSGSLVEDGTDLRFEVTDGAATVPVTLIDTPPPLFNEEVPVLLEGFWTGDSFTAERAIIRHDENYETPEEGNYEES